MRNAVESGLDRAQWNTSTVGGVSTHDGVGERVSREIWRKTVEREVSERHYKREEFH